MEKSNISFITACIFTFCFIFKGFTQDYQSIFGTISTSWNVMTGVCDYAHTKIQNVTGDTSINNLNYKKLTDTKGFLREDTLLGKAWLYDTISNSEHLIMDLSLEVSDTFYCFDYNWNAYPFIVDSVFYENNLKHVRFGNLTINQCSFNTPKVSFIEGLGCDAGLEFQGELMGDYFFTATLCQFKDGERDYHNSDIDYTDSCIIEGGGIEELYRSEIHLFPNPANDFIKLTFNNQQPRTISIYDQQGRLMKALPVVEIEPQISVSDLKSGIYFIQSNGHSQRFVKQ
jgi:hypothetical protein